MYNPKANYYFSNYYFKRTDLLNARFYAKRAYEHGFDQNYELNYGLGSIYEKLADIERSIGFYQNAFRLGANQELENKIRLLDELNYNESQYYLFNKENNTSKREIRDK